MNNQLPSSNPNSHANSPMSSMSQPQQNLMNQPSANQPVEQITFPTADDPMFQHDANVMSANFRSAASKVFALFKEAQAQQARSYQLGYEQCIRDLSHHIVQSIQRDYQLNSHNFHEFNPMQANVSIADIEAFCNGKINALKSAAMQSPGFTNNNTEMETDTYLTAQNIRSPSTSNQRNTNYRQ
jgi:hypothetical protein